MVSLGINLPDKALKWNYWISRPGSHGSTYIYGVGAVRLRSLLFHYLSCAYFMTNTKH